MPTKYVDGEEEQLELTAQIVREAQAEIVKLTRRPIPEHVRQLLMRLSRESFRLGFKHAHDRNTLKAELWPEEEVTR
jgi:hypothetical protein